MALLTVIVVTNSKRGMEVSTRPLAQTTLNVTDTGEAIQHFILTLSPEIGGLICIDLIRIINIFLKRD